jgi:hypothetical protein
MDHALLGTISLPHESSLTAVDDLNLVRSSQEVTHENVVRQLVLRLAGAGIPAWVYPAGQVGGERDPSI